MSTEYGSARGRGPLRPERALAPWLFQICHRVCIDMSRRRRDVPVGFADHGQHPAMAVDGPSLHATWMTFQVHRAIDHLPPDTRQIIRLTYLEGWSLPQTVELLGVPLGTVKSRSSRAHRQLSSVPAHLRVADEATAA